MANKKKKNMDDDILRSREDILRAQSSRKQSEKPEQKTDKQQEKEPSDISISKGQKPESISKDKQTDQKKIEQKPASHSEQPAQRKTEIPQFDLAEQIMSEQRKITAARRSPPEQNKKVQSNAQQNKKDYTIAAQPVSKTYRMKIVSEIVSRDIEELSPENK